VAQLRLLQLLMGTSEACGRDDEAERAHITSGRGMRKARRLGEAELTAAQVSK
jgi:hypothetical protein